ncbi:ATP-binding cassette domain-containing protein [Neptunomonas antarctica]|uniref:Thiamine transport system ATP-binding protein n=1 Tax=Neptunomonas antarctica TaxID=619304 RepID=A0A1N7P4K1_9GAMM|nr:ATP-binding cassette domain-containing protein [Neptunomonas antarctica]SIT05542.1 thiamine transport system ATP-binding protein [Neptunomonas antarctica]
MLNIQDLLLELDGWPLRYDLQVQAGEIVAIQGISGVGKTTLLNLIAGYLTPDSGTIAWNQHVLNDLSVEQRPVSMLFQDHNLFEHISVLENLCLGFKTTASIQVPIQSIKNAAAYLGVDEHLNKKPATLSGGQRQRIALIRTLLRPEAIVLLDEPFAELDPVTREKAALWTRDQAKTAGKTVLLVTHQEEDVARVADRKVILT